MNDTPTTTPRNNEWGIISKEDGHWSSHKRRERWIKTVPLKTSAELETELTAVTEQRDRLAEAMRKIQEHGLVSVDAFDELDRIDEIVDEALQSLNQDHIVDANDMIPAVKGGEDEV